MKIASIHAVVRILPMVKLGLRTIDPIEEHNRIVTKEGAVAFAKFGNPLRRHNISVLSDALADGYTPFLYVAVRTGSNYISFRAPISRIIARGSPPFHLQPSYYRELGLVSSLSFILSKQLEPCQIDKLWVASSQRPLQRSLMDSRCSMMFVTTKKPSALTRQAHRG